MISNLTQWQVRLRHELANATLSTNSALTQLLYYELLFEDKFIEGGCDSWEVFLKSRDLEAITSIQSVNSITLSTIKLLYDHYEMVDMSPETVICEEPTAANAIIQRLTTQGPAVSNYPELFTVACNDTSWLIQNCDNTTTIPSVCVDCCDPCEVHCSNARDINFISTCMMESERDGVCYDEFGVRNGIRNAINVMSVTAMELSTAPNIASSTSIVTSRTEVTLHIQLAAPGGVYCGAFPRFDSSGEEYLPDSLDIIRVQQFVGYVSSGANPNNIAEVFIADLVPSTEYSFYCFSFSASGDEMSLARALNQGAVGTLTTPCCRSVRVRLPTNSIAASNSTHERLLQVTLLHAPDSWLTVVTGVLVDGSNPPGNEQLLFPAQATFQVGDAVLSQRIDFQLSSATVDVVYTVEVTLYGPDASLYTVNFTDSGASFSLYDPLLGEIPSRHRQRRLHHENGVMAAPPPLLVSAEYSYSGESIEVSFDSSTDLAGVRTSGTTFDCAQILLFDNISCNATCRWEDASLLRVYPEVAFKLTDVEGIAQYNDVSGARNSLSIPIGSSVSVLEGVLRATGGTSDFVQNASITVTLPYSITLPFLRISAPTVIGRCDDLVLDLATSSNFAGGLFLNLSVIVDSTLASTNSVAAIQSHIDSTFTLNPPSYVPSHLFELSVEYTFIVRACNAALKCRVAEHTVSVVNSTAPYLTIAGSPMRIINPADPSIFHAISSIRAACNRTGHNPTGDSQRTLQYSWAILEDNLELFDLVSTSKTPLVFRLPAYQLAVDTVYHVYAYVRDSVSDYTVSNFVRVYVTPGRLVASIDGAHVLTLVDGQSHYLTAYNSYDEVDGISGLEKDFQYDWSCRQLEPLLASNCSAFLTLDSDPLGEIERSGNLNGTAFVTALADNASALVTVRVSDASNNRSSIASVTVQTIPATGVFGSALADAAVAFEVLSPVGQRCRTQEQYTSQYRFNAGDKVKVLASIGVNATAKVLDSVNEYYDTSNSDINSTWGITGNTTINATSAEDASLFAYWSLADALLVDTTFDMSDSQLTPASVDLLPLLAAGASTFTANFALQSGYLPHGGSYTLSLSVADSLLFSVYISTNVAPTAGSYLVLPTEGIELQTDFAHTASSWQDIDLPLFYAFGFLANDERQSFVPLTSNQEVPYASTHLPAAYSGDAHFNNPLLQCTVRVTDCLGANSFASTPINIQPDTSLRAGSALLLSVTAALNETVAGDVASVVRVVRLGTAVLNAVDCSGAPTDCATTYNREPCRASAHTCGPCLADYVGITGSSNSLCAALLNFTAKVDIAPDEGGRTRCRVDSDCTYNFATCRNRRCRVPSQSCPRGANGQPCSGGNRGTCRVVNRNTGAFFSDGACLVDDAYCEAKCVCRNNWHGTACEVTSQQLEVNIDTRLLLLQAFINATEFGDATPDTVQQWAEVLSALSRVPEQLDARSVKKILTLANAVFLLYYQSGADYEAIQPIFAALDSVLALYGAAFDVESSLAVGTVRSSSIVLVETSDVDLEAMDTILRSYMFAVSSSMLYGQNAVTSTLSSPRNLRMSVEALPLSAVPFSSLSVADGDTGDIVVSDTILLSSSSDSATIQLSEPQSQLEELQALPQSYVQLPVVYGFGAEAALLMSYSLQSKLLKSPESTLRSNPVQILLSHIPYSDEVYGSSSSAGLGFNCTPSYECALEGNMTSLTNCTAPVNQTLFTDATGSSSNTSSVLTEVSYLRQVFSPNCAVRNVIQYNDIIPIIEPFESVERTTCYDLDDFVGLYACRTNPGANLTAKCTGKAGVIIDRCPVLNTTVLCNTLANNDFKTSLFNYSSCEVESYTEFNVTCRCQLDADATFSVNSASGTGVLTRSLLSSSIPLPQRSKPELINALLQYGSGASFTSHRHRSSNSRSLQSSSGDSGNSNTDPTLFASLSLGYGSASLVHVYDYDSYFLPSDYRRSPHRSWMVYVATGAFLACALLLLCCCFVLGWYRHKADARVYAQRLAWHRTEVLLLNSRQRALVASRLVDDDYTAGGTGTPSRPELQQRGAWSGGGRSEGASKAWADPAFTQSVTPEVLLLCLPPFFRNNETTSSTAAAVSAASRNTPAAVTGSQVELHDSSRKHKASGGFRSSFLFRMWQEMCVFHRWIGIFAHFSAQYPRVARITALSFQILSVGCFCAGFYALLDVDDGTCSGFKDQRSCIEVASTVVSGKTECLWYTSNETCGFRQPQQSLATVIAVTFMSALLSVPVFRLAEIMILKLSIPALEPAASTSAGLSDTDAMREAYEAQLVAQAQSGGTTFVDSQMQVGGYRRQRGVGRGNRADTSKRGSQNVGEMVAREKQHREEMAAAAVGAVASKKEAELVTSSSAAAAAAAAAPTGRKAASTTGFFEVLKSTVVWVCCCCCGRATTGVGGTRAQRNPARALGDEDFVDDDAFAPDTVGVGVGRMGSIFNRTSSELATAVKQSLMPRLRLSQIAGTLAPLQKRRVDFIDRSSVDGDLDSLLSRIRVYSEYLTDSRKIGLKNTLYGGSYC